MRPSKNEAANEEALRLANALPKFRVKYFTPRKGNLNYSIPITFREPGAMYIRRGEKKEPVALVNPYQRPYYLNGGDEGLLSDLYTTLSKTAPVTDDSIKGRAFVTFKILKDGVIDPNSIRVMRNKSVPEDYLNAAIEAIKGLGKFEPGKFDGIPKNVAWNISIRYPVPPKYLKTSE